MQNESAKYRAVLNTFWSDMDVVEWETDKKLFYLWSFTNVYLDICGCYQVSTKVIAHETGIDHGKVLDLLAEFEASGKIRYDFSTKELLLLNWKKHNEGLFKDSNKNSVKAIEKGASQIKCESFKQVVFSWVGGDVAPTLPPTQTPYDNQNQNQNQNQKEEPTAAASSQASTTPTASAAVEQQQQGKVVSFLAESENQIRTAFRERHDFLLVHFPHLQLSVEEEQCVMKYRSKPLTCEAGVLVMEWCKRARVDRPEARGRDRPDEVAEILTGNDRVCAEFCGSDAEKRLFCEVLSRVAKRLKSRGGLPQLLTEDLLLDWFESLRSLGFERIAWGAKHLIENQVFFPALSEFRTAVLKAPRSVVPVVSRADVGLQRAENGAQALADILASLDTAGSYDT